MPKQKWNLAGMSVAELIDLRRQLDGAIGDKISRERSELQTRLSALESFDPFADLAALAGREGGEGAAKDGEELRERVPVDSGEPAMEAEAPPEPPRGNADQGARTKQTHRVGRESLRGLSADEIVRRHRAGELDGLLSGEE